MSNTEKQDIAPNENNATESRLSFADKAEKLLRTILVALGYEKAGTLCGEDLVTGITAWVTLLMSMKQEPGGSYASFWARAFLDAWRNMPSKEAAEAATNAVNEFAKRYPPMLDDALLDEQERDTKSDIQVLTAELDKQVQLVWQMEAENKALLKANEHHASELALARIERQRDNDFLNNELTKVRAELAQAESLVCKLSEAFTAEKTRTKDALVPLAKPERIEPGQRWAMIGTVVAYGNSETVATMQNGDWFNRKEMLGSDKWAYLGTGKV